MLAHAGADINVRQPTRTLLDDALAFQRDSEDIFGQSTAADRASFEELVKDLRGLGAKTSEELQAERQREGGGGRRRT